MPAPDDTPETGPKPRSRSATDTRPAWARHHLWQIQPVRDVMLIAGVFGLVWLGYKISVVTVPLLLAILLAYLVEPLIERVSRHRMVRRPFAVSTIIVLIAVVLVVPTVIGSSIAVVQGGELVKRIDDRSAQVVASIEDPDSESKRLAIPEGPWRTIRDKVVEASRGQTEAGGLAPGNEDMAMVVDWATNTLRTNVKAISSRVASVGADTVEAAIGMIMSVSVIAFTVFLTLFFFFFVSTGWPSVVKFRDSLIPSKGRSRTIELLSKMDRAIAGFIRGRLTIALIQAVLFTIGYWAIGVPGYLILGPLVAFLSIVPYLALVGVPVSIVLLYIETNGGFRDAWWWTLLAPIILYFGGQAADDYVLTPAIQGKETGLDTPTILFATLAGGALMGVYGLLLAIPLAACVKILTVEILVPRFKGWVSGEESDFLPIDEG